MATRRKASQKSSKGPKREQVLLSMPSQTLEALHAISRISNLPPDDVVVALVNELRETIARDVARQRVISRRHSMLSALLQLPAFQEALVQPKPKLNISNKIGNKAAKASTKH